MSQSRNGIPYCWTCMDHGEVLHPRWGARDCPEPYIPCPDCHGGDWTPQ